MMGIKFEGRKEKYKITAMAILLAVACILTYYFHGIVRIGAVFTHFFYIPIILASLWWKRKGLIVAVFLAALLIFSDFFIRTDGGTPNDYLRVLMLIFIACIVGMLSEQIAKVDEATKVAHAELNQIFDAAADGMRVIDKEFVMLRINETFASLSGISKDQALGKKCYEVFPGRLCHTPNCPLTRILGGEESVECDVERERNDGTNISCLLTATPFRSPSGELIGIIEDFKDITERKRAEEAKVESEKNFRTLFENVPTGIYRTTPDGRILMANPTLLRMLGYSSFDELASRNLELEKETFEPTYRRSYFKELLERESEINGLESAWTRRDNSVVFVHENVKTIRDAYGCVLYYEGTVEDITERKRAEKALRESEKKLRLLSSHLLMAQETERRRISIELHDELGQALAVLKLQLRSIQRKLRKDQTALREGCESTLKYIDQVIENVRRLSRDLSPTLLEDLGLSAALRWLIDDFAKHFHVKVSLDIADMDNFFSQKAQIIIYRIFQEALTNIAKHAQATQVSVVVKKKDGSVSFSLEDNGKGFDVKQAMMRNSTEKGLGLAAMDERTWMLGGSFDVWSQEGKGTRVSFTIPIGEG